MLIEVSQDSVIIETYSPIFYLNIFKAKSYIIFHLHNMFIIPLITVIGFTVDMDRKKKKKIKRIIFPKRA